MTAYNPFADELRKSLAKNPDLPTPYGSAALEPPDETGGDDQAHRPERINLATRCAMCGDIWPCETVEDKDRCECRECNE